MRGFGIISRFAVHALVAAMPIICAAPAFAESVADFYKGKTVRLLIGTSAGGEYDVLGRLVGRHLGKHIPGNPSVIGVNMPGAFGIPMSNHLYSRAERDGTVLGVVNNNHPMLEATGGDIRFKVAEFGWIGAIAPVENMMVVWATRGVKTIDDARKTELTVGSIGRGNLTYAFPTLMNDLVGTKFRVVIGYRGGAEVSLAMERGEVDARSTSWSSLKSTNSDWIREGKINFLVQAGPRSKEKDLASLPSIEDLARSADDKAVMDLIFAGSRMGRPIAAAPDIPADRLAALRRAYAATMQDPAFRKDAAQSAVDVDPVRGEELEAIVMRVQAMPKHVAQRAKKFLEQ
jgi:tripartite-type tricarboxylate transporter receptor subunit TctC